MREMQQNYNTSSWSGNNETNVEKTSRNAEPTKKKKKKIVPIYHLLLIMNKNQLFLNLKTERIYL